MITITILIIAIIAITLLILITILLQANLLAPDLEGDAARPRAGGHLNPKP